MATAALIHALLQAGEVERARALSEDTLRRCRRTLGPDHTVTLSAATALTLALVQLGEAEPTRTLGEDTLRRCRRTLSPDHPFMLYLTQATGGGDPMPGGDAAADRPDAAP